MLNQDRQVHEVIVSKLEEILTLAKKGEISGIAIALIDRNKQYETFVKYEQTLHIVGAASILHADIIDGVMKE